MMSVMPMLNVLTLPGTAQLQKFSLRAASFSPAATTLSQATGALQGGTHALVANLLHVTHTGQLLLGSVTMCSRRVPVRTFVLREEDASTTHGSAKRN